MLIVVLLVSDYLCGEVLSGHVGLTRSHPPHRELGPPDWRQTHVCDSDIQLFYAAKIVRVCFFLSIVARINSFPFTHIYILVNGQSILPKGF